MYSQFEALNLKIVSSPPLLCFRTSGRGPTKDEVKSI